MITNPLDGLHSFLIRLFLRDSWKAPHTKIGVGQLLDKMTKEERDAIQNLKSDDLSNQRTDSIFHQD